MGAGTTVSILPRAAMPETGTMIFTADAVYMGASYGPPVVPAGHDPDQIKQLRVAPTGSYR
jgi:N-acyl homoserine lactone hydrolase